jgi:hypothetical protein
MSFGKNQSPGTVSPCPASIGSAIVLFQPPPWIFADPSVKTSAGIAPENVDEIRSFRNS